jgi:3-deoxy-D-manno-octulosonic-acid transferase
MWYLAYNVLLLLAAPAIVAVLLAKPRCRRGLPQRFGILPDSLLTHPGQAEPVLWVHAVSLGEVVAVAPLVRQLHTLYPRYRILVSTVTETGREAVEQRLAGVARHFYAPLDFPWTVSKVVSRLRPSAFLFVETELWPNLLRELGKNRIISILVNGRLSSRSFGRYVRIKPFMRTVLGNVSLCLMQSDRDAERIVTLGADPARVVHTGNIKFDQPLPGQSVGSAQLDRITLGLADDEELMIAGSTHPGEEEMLLSCYTQLRSEFPRLVLMLAPRHIERTAQVEESVRAFSFVPLRRSDMGRAETHTMGDAPRVLILDSRGELAALYKHALISFVGGTLVPIGGHNLLEPAAWSTPVFFGPYTDHCAEVAHLLVGSGGGVSARDAAILTQEIRTVLRDREALQRRGRMARKVVEDNQGATERTLAHVTKALASVQREDRDKT